LRRDIGTQENTPPGIEAVYKIELKRAFGCAVQYLRHFWAAVAARKHTKTKRLRVALRALADEIERCAPVFAQRIVVPSSASKLLVGYLRVGWAEVRRRNRQLEPSVMERLEPLSAHLRDQMLQTALDQGRP
jgi:hypothetical protein